MLVAPQVLTAARKHRPAAMCELLEAYHPAVHRMAMGLCGDGIVAGQVIDRVFSRAMPAFDHWRDDTAADRWFYHFTVLESRRHPRPTGEAGDADTLLPAGQRDPAYAAFLRALRDLPPQQREAIILTYGEHLNPRYLAVAMDCSGEAASNHLREATRHLIALTGGQLEAMLESLAKVYRELAAPAEAAKSFVHRRVNRFLFPRRLRRTLFIVAVCAGAAAAWWWQRGR